MDMGEGLRWVWIALHKIDTFLSKWFDEDKTLKKPRRAKKQKNKTNIKPYNSFKEPLTLGHEIKNIFLLTWHSLEATLSKRNLICHKIFYGNLLQEYIFSSRIFFFLFF